MHDGSNDADSCKSVPYIKENAGLFHDFSAPMSNFRIFQALKSKDELLVFSGPM